MLFNLSAIACLPLILSNFMLMALEKAGILECIFPILGIFNHGSCSSSSLLIVGDSNSKISALNCYQLVLGRYGKFKMYGIYKKNTV